MSSIWGKNLKVSIFGESHGNGIGVVIDNFLPGIYFDEEFIYSNLNRRMPGRNFTSTSRKEADRFEIISGVYNGYTTGTPICAVIKNTDKKSGDYGNLKDIPRPSHSDYTANIRYKGYEDYRGSGHFSGRLTAPICFAGALCQLYLNTKNITIGSHILSVKDIFDEHFDYVNLNKDLLNELKLKEYNVISDKKLTEMLELIRQVKSDNDSVGGVIECGIVGLKQGVGSPIFNNIESKIASFLFSIPAVKGVEFGLGFNITKELGSSANDAFVLKNDQVCTATNHNGGINGGISNGMPIIVKTAIKPTPSISSPQNTLNMETKNMDELIIKGRHDPSILTRCGVVIECAVAIAITDLLMEVNHE